MSLFRWGLRMGSVAAGSLVITAQAFATTESATPWLVSLTTWLWIALALLFALCCAYLRWQLSKTRAQLKKSQATAMPHSWIHDELTGLPNLRLLQQRVQQRVLRQAPGALLLVQIRHFEHVNRMLGYQHANLVLTQIAFRLNEQLERCAQVMVIEAVPQMARVCHLGGVEFALFVETAEHHYLAEQLAHQLVLDVPEPLMLHGGVIDYQLAVGVALYPEHSTEVSQLVHQARMALYQRTGPGADAFTHPVFVYQPELTLFNQQRLAMMAQLQQAQALQQLQLDVQPQIELATGQVVAGEVLVRWLHPTQGLLMPKQFIPMAEQLGILYPMTCWIVEQALDVVAALPPEQAQIQIAVNIASKDLLHAELVEFLASALTKRQLNPRRLILECREEALLQEPERTIGLLHRLSELGVVLALDDFGTGYTSLGMLREMPIQQVKVDCQFVSDVHRSDAQAAVTGAIIDMAKNMQWQVVAEGVEEQAAADKLARMGCMRGQGYFYSRPFALHGFGPWLAQYDHARHVQR